MCVCPGGLCQDLRQAVAMTITTLSMSSVFLGSDNKGSERKAAEECLKFLGTNLGVTKADIGKISVPWQGCVLFTSNIQEVEKCLCPLLLPPPIPVHFNLFTGFLILYNYIIIIIYHFIIDMI